ncbi:TPA: tetratricopeptide repeat protein [Neisseria oralis]
MMDVNGLISVASQLFAASQLFNEKKYAEAIEKLHQALDGITDKSTQIREQIEIQSGFGRCYFEQAMKAKDTDEADKLFEKAVEHYQEWLRLAKQLADEQNNIQGPINAQSWLGRCYYEQAIKTKDTDKADKLFEKAVEHFREWLRLAKADGQNSIQQQINARFWLSICYFEQAKRTKDAGEAVQLFGQAAEHNQERLQLAKQLADRGIQEQIDAQVGLGICYFEQAKKSKNPNRMKAFFKCASEYLENADKQILQLNDKENAELKKGIHPYLRDSYYFGENWDSYFKKKKQETQESLFKGGTSQPQDAVATVLAVLHIPPIELGSIPLAHYTSPHVCHKLFGIGGNETASPMRIGSSTYMNDPSEGRGLLDLLNQQDLELENKADGASHNAFFTCFSSRVNDLNQFRLYGKEDGVEASGCCLVFNKNGDWLKEADVSVPFRSLSQKSGQDSDGLPETGFSGDEYEKLPLYQVAYIAYKDEYIADKKCRIWFPSQKEPKFGIRLKPVGNEKWHQFRLKKLKEALEALIGFFEDKSAVSDDDKEALEYIRYLFKDFAFRDEEEFRLLVIKPIDSEEIEYCEKTQSVYIPYADIRNRADEVILGTNYEKTGNQRKAEVFRYQMKQKCPDVKVSRSTLPINPPNK